MRYSVVMLTMAGREPSMRLALQKVLTGASTPESIAERNFLQLVEKWSDKGIRFEGPSVGLVGPAPGKRIAQ